jgi:hypothetical protein
VVRAAKRNGGHKKQIPWILLYIRIDWPDHWNNYLAFWKGHELFPRIVKIVINLSSLGPMPDIFQLMFLYRPYDPKPVKGKRSSGCLGT